MSGPNRQAKQERQQRAHRTVKGAPPPSGRHKETRKERDRRRNGVFKKGRSVA